MSIKGTMRYIVFRAKSRMFKRACDRAMRRETALAIKIERFVIKYGDFIDELRKQHPDFDNACSNIGFEQATEETNTDEINDVFDI